MLKYLHECLLFVKTQMLKLLHMRMQVLNSFGCGVLSIDIYDCLVGKITSIDTVSYLSVRYSPAK